MSTGAPLFLIVSFNNRLLKLCECLFQDHPWAGENFIDTIETGDYN